LRNRGILVSPLLLLRSSQCSYLIFKCFHSKRMACICRLASVSRFQLRSRCVRLGSPNSTLSRTEILFLLSYISRMFAATSWLCKMRLGTRMRLQPSKCTLEMPSGNLLFYLAIYCSTLCS